MILFVITNPDSITSPKVEVKEENLYSEGLSKFSICFTFTPKFFEKLKFVSTGVSTVLLFSGKTFSKEKLELAVISISKLLVWFLSIENEITIFPSESKVKPSISFVSGLSLIKVQEEPFLGEFGMSNPIFLFVEDIVILSIEKPSGWLALNKIFLPNVSLLINSSLSACIITLSTWAIVISE